MGKKKSPFVRTAEDLGLDKYFMKSEAGVFELAPTFPALARILKRLKTRKKRIRSLA